jgi:hypothetical protein
LRAFFGRPVRAGGDMEIAIILVVLAVFFGLFLWGLDQHLCLKDLEIDLKEYLQGVEEARVVSEPPLRVHFNAQVFAIRTLVRKHFKIKD